MSKYFLTAVLASFVTIQSAGAAELRTLRYGIGLAQSASGGGSQDQAGLGALPYIVAQRKGFFEQEGIRLQFVHTAQRPPLSNQETLFDSLGKGEFDMTRSQLSFLILHVLEGGDFAAVAGNTANQLWSLMARPEIKDFADLKGKTVALTLPFDLISLSMLKMLDRHGIKKADMRISVITGSPPRAICVQTGECAAAALNEPYDSDLAAQGFHALGDSREIPPIPFIAEIVNKTWAQANQDTVVGYVRAFASAMRYINDPKNADDVRPMIREVTQGSDETARELLSRYYYNTSYPYLPRQAELDVDGLGRVLALMAEYDQIPKPVPPTSRFADLRYAHAAGVQ
jgi:ABC-type nitrate/sulfonate/bicarbonate transport system substrate-binding protein